MKKKGSLFILILFIWGVWGAAAQDTTSSVSLNVPASGPFEVGSVFSIEVETSIISPAYAFGFQLCYDPVYLDVFKKADRDGAEVPIPVGPLFGEEGAQRVKNTLFTGAEAHTCIDVVYTFLGERAGIVGSGSLATASFRALTPGETNISIKNPRLIALTEGKPIDLPTHSQNDSVSVVLQEESSIQPTKMVAHPTADSGQESPPAFKSEVVEPESGIPTLYVLIVAGVGVGMALTAVLVLRHRKATMITPQKRLKRARRLIRSGDKKGARNLLMKVLNKDADNCDALYLLAYASQTPKQAVSYLKRVLILDPGHRQARQTLKKLMQRGKNGSIHH